MLSSYQLKIANICNIPICNIKKLVPNVFDKEMYVLLYENLKLYLRLGLKLKKVHHVLEFNKSQWLNPYVKFNTKKRIDAERNGEALYQLMNNTVYGKTMENLRNRIDVKLVSNKKDYIKWTSKSCSMSQRISDNDIVAIRKSKVTLTLKKPAYVGMCILDLSKVLMYKFDHDYIKNRYGNN